MGIVVVPTYGSDPATINAANLDAKVAGLATEFNGEIDNDNIASDAAIANSKLNLASVAQNVSFAGTVALTGVNTISGVTTMSSKIFKEAKGADVASVAGAITLGDDGNYFDITGTNAITSITAKTAGTIVTLQFDSTASLVDGSNLKLNGNFQGAAESQITLRSDGTNWFEVCRSPISVPSAASQAEMEAASSNTVYATPGRVVNHPGVAKVWLNFDGSGSDPITPTIAYGISGSTIAKGSTGVYTITFATAFSSTNYCMTSQAWDTTVPIGCTVRMATKNVGSVVIECYRTATGTLTDAEEINIAIWGDQ